MRNLPDATPRSYGYTNAMASELLPERAQPVPKPAKRLGGVAVKHTPSSTAVEVQERPPVRTRVTWRVKDSNLRSSRRIYSPLRARLLPA
jgi:hypothetical protein